MRKIGIPEIEDIALGAALLGAGGGGDPYIGKLMGIAHGDCEADAQLLRDMIVSRTGAEDFLIRCMDLCTGAHAGPGALAVFYFSKTGRTAF